MTGTGFDREFTLDAPATEEAVRDLLADLQARLSALGVSAALRGRVELPVAEALNNIVEHAYGAAGGGPVRITARLGARHLCITLRDRGQALPENRCAPHPLPDSNGSLDSLPEGGFGLFLIRHLTDGMSYRRENGENHLVMAFSLGPGGHGRRG